MSFHGIFREQSSSQSFFLNVSFRILVYDVISVVIVILVIVHNICMFFSYCNLSTRMFMMCLHVDLFDLYLLVQDFCCYCIVLVALFFAWFLNGFCHYFVNYHCYFNFIIIC